MANNSYYIYLIGRTEGRGSGKPQAPSSDNTAPSTTVGNGENGFDLSTAISGTLRFAKSPIGFGTSKLAKAFPYVAATLAVAKVADNVFSTTNQVLSNITGDYRMNMDYNNVKIVLGNVLNPINYVMNRIEYNAEIFKDEIRSREESRLTGNIIVNTKGRDV